MEVKLKMATTDDEALIVSERPHTAKAGILCTQNLTVL
jgi:hypothetical protein